MDGQGSSQSFPSNVTAILQEGVEYMSEAQLREVKPFRCTICQKGFATEAYFKQHYRIHTGEKAYGPCGTCGKSFRQLSHLQQHVRSHTGDKPYKCPVPGCGKYFGQLGNLKCHNKRVHCGIKKKKNSSKSIKLEPPESQPGSPSVPSSSELADSGASSSPQIYRETLGNFSGFHPKEEIREPNPSVHQSPLPTPASDTPIFDFHRAAPASAQPQQMNETRVTAEPDEIFDDSILNELEHSRHTMDNEWFESVPSSAPSTAREVASTGAGNQQSSWPWSHSNLDDNSQMIAPPQAGFGGSFQSSSIGPSIATSVNIRETNRFPSGREHYRPRHQEPFQSGHQVRPHFPVRTVSVPTDRSSAQENDARQGGSSEFLVFHRPQTPEAQAESRYEDWQHTSSAQGHFRGTVHSLAPIGLPVRAPGPSHPHSTIAGARNYSVPNFSPVTVPNYRNYPPHSSSVTSFSFLGHNFSAQHLPSQREETGGSADSFFSGGSHNPSLASSHPAHSAFDGASLNPGTENFSTGPSHHDTIGFARQNPRESSDPKGAFNSANSAAEPQPEVPLPNYSASPQEIRYPQPIHSRQTSSSFTSSYQSGGSSNLTQTNPTESGPNDVQEDDFWSTPAGVLLMRHAVIPVLRTQARARSNAESNSNSSELPNLPNIEEFQ